MDAILKLVSPRIRHAIYEAVINYKSYQNEIHAGLFVLVVVYLVTLALRRPKGNYPPGPRGLPIVGYLPYLSENTHLDFIKLGNKYGDVFSLRLGSKNVVVLNGAEVIRDALSKDEFLGKPPDNPLKFYNEKSAFFVNDVHSWREQRRFIVQSMKDLGLGKTKIEGEVQEEIKLLLSYLKNFNGQAVDLKVPLSPSMSNNICALVFGKRLDYNDPDRKLLDKNLDEGVEFLFQTSYTAFLPWINYLPFISSNGKMARKLFGEIKQFCRKVITKHKETFDPTNIRDFIDSYFIEMRERQKEDINSTFHEETLVANVVDLFSAGSESVKTSILWSVYCVAAFPEVQKRVQQEIKEVMGDREPDFQDLKTMPYTHATIMELQRWKTIVPINLTRYTASDSKVKGYDIPAGTTVICNFWGVHHDPRYWLDPESFEPERFLSEDGNSVVKSQYYFPFSLGKRSCPGKTMAYMEIFMYFTAILQKFDVRFPEGVKPTFDAQLGITYKPKHYEVRFVARK